jgi:hypothetical protein
MNLGIYNITFATSKGCTPLYLVKSISTCDVPTNIWKKKKKWVYSLVLAHLLASL